jgi:hypothetical protein
VVRFSTSVVRLSTSVVRFSTSVVRLSTSVVRHSTSVVRLSTSVVRLSTSVVKSVSAVQPKGLVVPAFNTYYCAVALSQLPFRSSVQNSRNRSVEIVCAVLIALSENTQVAHTG